MTETYARAEGLYNDWRLLMLQIQNKLIWARDA